MRSAIAVACGQPVLVARGEASLGATSPDVGCDMRLRRSFKGRRHRLDLDGVCDGLSDRDCSLLVGVGDGIDEHIKAWSGRPVLPTQQAVGLNGLVELHTQCLKALIAQWIGQQRGDLG